jgi:hypothetical protein
MHREQNRPRISGLGGEMSLLLPTPGTSRGPLQASRSAVNRPGAAAIACREGLCVWRIGFTAFIGTESVLVSDNLKGPEREARADELNVI